MIVDRTRLRRSLGVREDGSKETSMTKQADFKARVRARMARTGESYATARAHLLASRPAAGAARDQRRHDRAGHRGHRARGAHHAVARRPARGPGARRAGRRAAAHPRRVPGRRRRGPARGARPHARASTATASTSCGSRPTSTTSSSSSRSSRGCARSDVPAERITLICVGEHLGIAHFGGLGELSSEQLARLPGHAATTLTAGEPRARDARLGRPARARPGRPRRHRRHPVARAAVRRRGLRPAQPRVPVHARRAVADRAAPAGRRRRRRADRRRRVRRASPPARRGRSSATRGPSTA